MIRDYIELTKPRITWLILMSTAIGYFFGMREGWQLWVLLHTVLDIYKWLVIVAAIVSLLIAFRVLDTRNRLVWTIADFLYRATEPALRPIRRFMPACARKFGPGLKGSVSQCRASSKARSRVLKAMSNS